MDIIIIIVVYHCRATNRGFPLWTTWHHSGDQTASSTCLEFEHWKQLWPTRLLTSWHNHVWDVFIQFLISGLNLVCLVNGKALLHLHTSFSKTSKILIWYVYWPLMEKEEQFVGDGVPAYHRKQQQLNKFDGSEDTEWRKHDRQTQTWRQHDQQRQVIQVFPKKGIPTGGTRNSQLCITEHYQDWTKSDNQCVW